MVKEVILCSIYMVFLLEAKCFILLDQFPTINLEK